MTTTLAAREDAPATHAPRPRSTRGLLVTIACLGLLDALVLYALFALAVHDEWGLAAAAALSAVVINAVYLRRGALPAKYLVPGTAFLVVFQLFVILYSGYIAFTNYGDGHVGTKDDAIAVLINKSLTRVPDSASYDMVVVTRDDELSFLVTDPDGRVSLGGEGRPLDEVADARIDGGVAVELDGYRTLDFAEMIADQRRIAAMSVPFSQDPEDGALRTQDGSLAYRYAATMDHDPVADTVTDLTTGTVYRDRGTGAFVADDGAEVMPGWKIAVGLENFTRAVTEESIRGPLLGVIGWTFVFAGVSVLSTFVAGVLLALLLDDPRIRLRRTLRVLVILPYAFPPFLSALVWGGLLNPEFGFIN